MYNLGILYNMRQEYELGIQTLESSISYCTDNSHAYLALGDAYEKLGNFEVSIRIFKKLG
jgi:tetratricopeptide (TPR) repeat protein